MFLVVLLKRKPARADGNRTASRSRAKGVESIDVGSGQLRIAWAEAVYG
jgi:hypothetical protein